MKKRLFIIGFILSPIIIFYLNSERNEGPVTFIDYPYSINDKTDTIEVAYIAWACACANWLPSKNEISERGKNCIFIESKTEKLRIPEDYNQKIRLIGQYYTNFGISRDYVKPTSEKPEKARVFRHTSFELIN